MTVDHHRRAVAQPNERLYPMELGSLDQGRDGCPPVRAALAAGEQAVLWPRLRPAGARLLLRAEAEGIARADIDGSDLFALVGAPAWLGDWPSFAPRADPLFDVIASTILTNRLMSSTTLAKP